MKYKFITSLLFFGLFLCSAQSQTAEIPIQEVIEKFYTTYDLSTLPYSLVEFEKRKNNWYIKTIDFENNKPVRSAPRLFYDGAKKLFIELQFHKNTSVPVMNYLTYIDPNEEYNYNIQPFYGYPGWYHDVINEYRGNKNLSDKQLYALARAYSSRSIAPITNQADDAPDKDIFKLPFSTEAFSKQQLKEFVVNVDSGIEKFHELSLRSPRFSTKVGDIRDKYANEIMFKFHQLLTFSKNAADKMVIPRNIYKDSLLNLAKDWLKSCPSQSILVSFGDNDFYPVLYLQKVEGFRKDVYIINYNLLGVDKYIYRATQPQFDAKGIQLSVDTSVYKGDVNDFIYRKSGTSDVHSVEQLISKLRQYAHPDSAHFELIADNINLDLKIKASASEVVTGKTPNIYLKDATYLLKSDWILLDIINNTEDRKIALTNGFFNVLEPLNAFLEPLGSVFVLKWPR